MVLLRVQTSRGVPHDGRIRPEATCMPCTRRLWGDFTWQITGKDTNGNLTKVGGWQNNRGGRH